jgi:uncharacterized protein YhaN
VRGDGAVLLPGQLSEATRQQLYLAARLAWAERYNGESEPMPLVLDDVLAAFDESRARAALEVLASLPGQKLLLTHHAHVVALAREVVPAVEILSLPAP